MAGQHPVHHRWLDRLAKPLRQGRSNRGHHHQGASGGAFHPRFQERVFFLRGEQGLPSTAPVARGGGPRRPLLAEGGLESSHGRTAHSKDVRRVFKSRPEQGRQQYGLTWSQGLDRGGGGGGPVRPLHDEWINPAWSWHAKTLPLVVSS